jgi:hypothetical protein
MGPTAMESFKSIVLILVGIVWSFFWVAVLGLIPNYDSDVWVIVFFIMSAGIVPIGFGALRRAWS